MALGVRHGDEARSVVEDPLQESAALLHLCVGGRRPGHLFLELAVEALEAGRHGVEGLGQSPHLVVPVAREAHREVPGRDPVRRAGEVFEWRGDLASEAVAGERESEDPDDSGQQRDQG